MEGCFRISLQTGKPSLHRLSLLTQDKLVIEVIPSGKVIYLELPGDEIMPKTKKNPTPVLSSKKTAEPSSVPVPAATRKSAGAAGDYIGAFECDSSRNLSRLENHRQDYRVSVGSS